MLNKNKKSLLSIALAGSILLPVGGSIIAPNYAFAAETAAVSVSNPDTSTASNITATTNVIDGRDYNYTDYYKTSQNWRATVNWDVPKTVKPGDTVTITAPADTILMHPYDLEDENGNIIATVSQTGTTSETENGTVSTQLTYTYTDYVAKYHDIKLTTDVFPAYSKPMPLTDVTLQVNNSNIDFGVKNQTTDIKYGYIRFDFYRTLAVVSATPNEVAKPTANNDSVVTDYNTPINIDVLKNDILGSDTDSFKTVELKQPDGTFGNTLTTEYGTFTVNDDNTVKFTPKDGYNGTVPDVDYRVTDSNNNTADATITVKVNDNPNQPIVTGKDDLYNTPENTPKALDVFENDETVNDSINKSTLTLFDKDGNKVDAVTVTGGIYTVDEGVLNFTPNKDFTGEAGNVVYGATTDSGIDYKANVNVTVTPKIPPVPPMPDDTPKPSVTGVDDNAHTKYNTAVDIDVFGNDKAINDKIQKDGLALIDSEGFPVLELKVKGGTYSVNANNGITFTPDKDFSGKAETVKYGTRTDSGLQYTANITVDVDGPVTTPPTDNETTVKGVDDNAKTKENTPVTVDVFSNDTVTNGKIKKDSLTLFDKDNNPTDTVKVTGGTYTVNDKLQVVFTPDTGFSGKAGSVKYGAMTENGMDYTANVNVDVVKDVVTPPKDDTTNPPSDNTTTPPKDDEIPKDDAAVKGGDDTVTTKVNHSVNIDVFKNDSTNKGSIKKDSLTLFDKKGNPTDTVKVKGGTYSINNNLQVIFTPDKDFVGKAESIQYGAITTEGLEYKNTINVTVTKDGKPVVTDTNDNTPPVSNDNNDTTDDSPVNGPKIVTDLVGANDSSLDASGLAGITALTIIGGAAVIRRKRNK